SAGLDRKIRTSRSATPPEFHPNQSSSIVTISSLSRCIPKISLDNSRRKLYAQSNSSMPAGAVARGSQLGAERKRGGASNSTSQGSEQSAYHGAVDHAAFRRLQKTREKGSVHSGVNGMRSCHGQCIRCFCRCCRGGKGIGGWARNQAGRGFLLR